MFFERVKANNFKSFASLDIGLSDLTFLIGPNAAGKSNLIELFRFLRNAEVNGLTNAISMVGGPKFLTNSHIGTGKPVTIFVQSGERPVESWRRNGRHRQFSLDNYKTSYELVFRFLQRGDARVVSEKFIHDLTWVRNAREEKDRERGEAIRIKSHSVYERNDRGRLAVTHNAEPLDGIDIAELVEGPLAVSLTEHPLPKDLLLLQTRLYMPMPLLFGEELFKNISVYDIDPKLSKQVVPVTGKRELDEDGGNLPIVLEAITRSKNAKRQLANLLSDLLPYVRNIRVSQIADKSLLLRLEESFHKGKYMPAGVLSDGTMRLLAILIPLFFQDNPFVILEEPGRNLHPELISRLVNLFRQASTAKQILVSTHNPEFVRHARMHELVLATRDRHGFSRFVRAENKKLVKDFLKSNLGLDDLFVQGVLNA